MDGPGLLLEGTGTQNTRVSKSSLHQEALAANATVEKTQKISGILGEFYLPPRPLLIQLALQEAGRLPFPIDLIVDAKSFYDLMLSTLITKTSDEGSLLYIKWCKERYDAGAVRAMYWSATSDMLADGLTKAGVDPFNLLKLMMESRIETTWAALREGRLEDAQKGLPPPKTAKDRSAFIFLTAFHEAGGTWEHFVALCQGLMGEAH